MGAATGSQGTPEFGLASKSLIYPIKVTNPFGETTSDILIAALTIARDDCLANYGDPSSLGCIVYFPLNNQGLGR